eukprot:XP_001709325.1 Hypothetical protein GL50803_35902 [Giardia lamblia ATCC 50803]
MGANDHTCIMPHRRFHLINHYCGSVSVHKFDHLLATENVINAVAGNN